MTDVCDTYCSLYGRKIRAVNPHVAHPTFICTKGKEEFIDQLIVGGYTRLSRNNTIEVWAKETYEGAINTITVSFEI